MLWWIVAVTVAVAAAGCGTRTAIRGGSRSLTVTDNGATVRLTPGQSVTVVLVAQGMFSWHIPTVTGTGARQVSRSGGYPGDQPARARFLATSPGTTTLVTTDDTACLHARPACLPPQRQWRVTLLIGRPRG